jgi:hypothetical protein
LLGKNVFVWKENILKKGVSLSILACIFLL